MGAPPETLATTNIIESPHAEVRMRTRRVCRWRDGSVVKRRLAAALLATEKNFRTFWALDAQRIEICHPTGGGVVRWRLPPPLTFNGSRDTLVHSMVCPHGPLRMLYRLGRDRIGKG